MEALNRSNRAGKRAAIVFAALGASIVIATSLIGGAVSVWMVPFVLWGLLPYALLLLLPRLPTSPPAIIGAGAAAITVETGIRAAVFLFPTGSTDAIALVFSPLLIVVVAMPAGWLGGTLIAWCFARFLPATRSR